MKYDIVQVRLDGVPKTPYKDGIGKYRGVCAHATANYGSGEEEDTAQSERNWEQTHWEDAFVHYFADYSTILDVADDDYISYGCGGGNPYFINVELCQTKMADRFIESYNRWIYVMAKVLFDRKLGVIDGVTLVSHKWVRDNLGGTTHDDPHTYIESHGKNWDNVIQDVKTVYTQMEGEETVANEIIHERIYATNGKLTTIANPKTTSGAYKISATDVRFIKFDKNRVTMRLVWEKDAKVSDLVKKYGADFGINAPFFFQSKPVADCIVDGKVINQGYGKQVSWHGFGYKNGVGQLGYLDTKDGYDFLLKTTPYLISNGNPAWDYYRIKEETAPDIGKGLDGNYVRAERTFFGIDKDGNYLVAVSDGRTSSDRGLTLEEMSLYMQNKGAMNAINFDGGSSSVIADKTGMQNAQPRGEVPVNHALLFFIKKDDIPVSTPQPPKAVDWKQVGFDYLVSNYGLDASQHKPTDIVDLGTLGTLIKRRDEKK